MSAQLCATATTMTLLFNSNCVARTSAIWILCFYLTSLHVRAFGFHLEGVSSDEIRVRDQLSYLPKNFVRVSAWTADHSSPVAIQSYPLEGGAHRRQKKAKRGSKEVQKIGTPFPTLFWLTCPRISKAVAGLEQKGYVKKVEEIVRADKELSDRMLRSHKEYAAARWASLTQEDRTLLSTSGSYSRIMDMLHNSGIAGANTTNVETFPPIKCLHAHYAHFRSLDEFHGVVRNPVGEIVHELLQRLCEDIVL